MSRFLLKSMIIAMVLMLVPVGALAYTYGDANTEDVAETFKLIASSLTGSSPDWKSAEAAHQARRPEIAAHFGEPVAVTLDENIKAKDTALTVANYKAVLVMNLERRFQYAMEDVDDYTKAKLLLAKAKVTYETLEPYVKDSAKVAEAKDAFDKALEALGNPGLFGVGKEEAQPDVFKEQIDAIYNGVKGLFPYTAYKKPEAAKPDSGKTGTKTPANPVVQPEPEVKEEPATNNDQKPAEDQPVEPTDQQNAEADVTADDDPAGTAEPTDSAGTDETGEAENGDNASIENGETAADAADDSASSEQLPAAAEEHAPMERTDKTNPAVTFSLIGGVLAIAAGVLWYVKKKGLL